MKPSGFLFVLLCIVFSQLSFSEIEPRRPIRYNHVNPEFPLKKEKYETENSTVQQILDGNLSRPALHRDTLFPRREEPYETDKLTQDQFVDDSTSQKKTLPPSKKNLVQL